MKADIDEELNLSQSPSNCDVDHVQIKSMTPASSRRFLRSNIEPTVTIGGLVGISKLDSCLEAIISIIEDPIQCGYFRNFCEAEHCLPYISFVLEVIKFRQFIKTECRNNWTLSWEEIDAMDHENSESNYWPDNTLRKEAIEAEAQRLWISYLCKSADSRVLLSADILERTRERIRSLGMYGPTVFGEAIQASLLELTKGLLPSFLISPICTDMVVRIDTLLVTPLVNSMRVKSPANSIILTNNPLIEYRRFSLKEILNDKILYSEFFDYLLREGAIHNLLCYQMILEYEEEMAAMSTSKDLTKAWSNCVALAWNIFRYFIADGAPFEVHIPSWAKYDVMLLLSKPSKIMYIPIKKIVMRNITTMYGDYKLTDEYERLVDLLRYERDKALESTRISFASVLRAWEDVTLKGVCGGFFCFWNL